MCASQAEVFDEESSSWLDINNISKFRIHGNFFNPNICHFCKKRENGDLVPCDECYMISYCTMDHRLMHYAYHMKICTAMRKLSQTHVEFWTTSGSTLEKWIHTRKELLRLIKLELSRDLQSDEVQMIMFSKSCLICRQQTNLRACTKCYSVNYCSAHADRLEDPRSHSCKQLTLCYQIDFELLFSSKRKKFALFPDKDKPVTDMDTFLEQFVCPLQYINGVYSRSTTSYFYSDYASDPLTLHHGMRIIATDLFDFPSSRYVIHIIAANSVDREYLPAWELLLHLLPKINDLTIILTGSELRTECNRIKICYKCAERQKYLNFEAYCMSYRDYVSSDKYKRPDVIAGFQADLSNWETLSETILKIEDQNCPLLLTAKSIFIAEQNEIKMTRDGDSSLDILFHDKNRFSSYKPYRDFENNGVSYRNKYLAVYRKIYL